MAVPILAAAALALGVPPPAPGWSVVRTGPTGGTVWVGRIPNSRVASDRRASAVYLPPGYDAARGYPVLYLLHGMRGAPSEFWDSLRLADVAHGLISSGPIAAVHRRHACRGAAREPRRRRVGRRLGGLHRPGRRPLGGRAPLNSLLVRAEAPELRRTGVRFYVSAGGNHGAVLSRWTVAFAGELRSLRLPYELWLLPAPQRGHFWRATLPSALLDAFAS